MSSTVLEGLLTRDRRIVIAAIVVLTALAWIHLLWLARGMSMPGMDMSMAMSPMSRAWTIGDFTVVFLMWAIMMVGMMTPSAVPMVLIYARVARYAEEDGRPLAATGWFAGGYLVSWTAFSLFATSAQGLLERATLLTPMMIVASNKIGAAILVMAGIYQFLPWKDSCLKQCQSPFAFIQAHGGFRRGMKASIELGLRHGFYCIGCCWALMTLLFVGGVMNIFWIAVIAVHILLEKILPERPFSRVAGAGLAIAGLWLFFR